jgi:hypothetical protein
MKTMVDDEKKEVSRSSIIHLIPPSEEGGGISFRSLNQFPYSARFSIQARFWDRFFLFRYSRCFSGRGTYHGSRPGRCGFERLCKAVQGEDRGEEEAGPIAVGPSSGLCVSDGIGGREGGVARRQGKSTGGVEGLEGSGEDGIGPCRSTTRSRCIDLESYRRTRLLLAPCLL